MLRRACAGLLIATSLLTLAVAPTTAGAAPTTVTAPTAATAMPVGDLDGWRQVFTDDFGTAVPLGSFPEAVGAKWSAYPSPWRDTSGHGTYSPHDVVSVADGLLTEHVHTAGGTARVAALVPKLPASMLYGRYSVRFRFDPMPGYKMAWMLWPDSDDGRRDGEIDFPEMNLDDQWVSAFDHRTDGISGSDQSWARAPLVPGSWHTTTIEWSPNLVVFLLDGLEIGRNTVRTPHVPMHWVLQTETAIGPATAPDPAVQGDVQIDWVAAWALDPAARAPLPARYVKLAAPAIAAGVVTLAATGSAGVDQVKWVVNGVEVGWDGTAPLSATWDSNSLPNGIYPIYAKAHDAAGWFSGPTQSLTIDNVRSSLVAPSTATGTVTLSAVASPWVTQVKWVVDGIEVGSREAAPWSMSWDSRTVRNGVHTIYSKSQDRAGWYDGPPQTITVAN